MADPGTGPNAHSRTRKDHATELTEDYVEAIAEIAGRAGVCRVRDLAERFDVSHVTVNRAVARMVRDGFVETAPYAPVSLTTKGSELAVRARTRHQIVFRFLRALGVGSATAAVDSEGIEHHVSDETLHIMQQFADASEPADA
jgi:DtxR family transcriptional regulator, manganese transport regulator